MVWLCVHLDCSHLPLSHGQLVLQLNEPVLLDIISTVVNGEDHWSGQQCPCRSTTHHWAQHRLDVLHRGSGEDKSHPKKRVTIELHCRQTLNVRASCMTLYWLYFCSCIGWCTLVSHIFSPFTGTLLYFILVSNWVPNTWVHCKKNIRACGKNSFICSLWAVNHWLQLRLNWSPAEHLHHPLIECSCYSALICFILWYFHLLIVGSYFNLTVHLGFAFC